MNSDGIVSVLVLGTVSLVTLLPGMLLVMMACYLAFLGNEVPAEDGVEGSVRGELHPIPKLGEGVYARVELTGLDKEGAERTALWSEDIGSSLVELETPDGSSEVNIGDPWSAWYLYPRQSSWRFETWNDIPESVRRGQAPARHEYYVMYVYAVLPGDVLLVSEEGETRISFGGRAAVREDFATRSSRRTLAFYGLGGMGGLLTFIGLSTAVLAVFRM